MKINIFGHFSSSSLCYISLFTFFIPFFLNFILHFGLTFLSLVYLVHTYSLLFVLYSTSQYIELYIVGGNLLAPLGTRRTPNTR